MPRKTRAVKKETPVDSKDEEAASRRRSGRSVTKSEPSTAKDASRSRRSSTAAQTAASVADSKSPKSRSSTTSRRDSSSPSDTRTRGGKEGLETPATRVKSARRGTGPVSYKESDGEEEAPTPKYDENFDSGDEFDESDSDEKSKPRGRSKTTRTAARGRGAKEKTQGRTRGRRGRPSKKKTEEEEESKTYDVSDDSMDLEVVATKEADVSSKEKVAPKSRGRRQKADIVEDKTDTKPKSSRRSARSGSSKEESPKKRPSRNVQAKKYTEDEEDDIEDVKDDIEDAKDDIEDEKTETEGARKRKRESSPEDSNKRLKESENQQTEEIEKESEEAKEEVKDSNIETTPAEDKTVEEPMEVDECDSGIVSQDDSSKTQEEEEKPVVTEDKKEENVEQKQETSPLKEKVEESKQEKLECPPDSDNKSVDKRNHSSPEAVETEDSKENAKEITPDQKSQEEIEKQSATDISSQSSEGAQPVDGEDDKNLSPEAPKETEKISPTTDHIKESNISEVHANDVKVSEESKSVLENPTSLSIPTESSTISATNSSSPEPKSDHALNGAENVNEASNPIPVPPSSEVIVENKENSLSKENGAYEDVHTNSNTSVDQYCLLPGRKYKVNSRLKEGVLQSVKGQPFGFVSYNLASDMGIQKEKLLNELHKLNSHIICLQQVPKPFYSAVLEPNLDALGYKSVFCQPEDSLKGMATFYKNSLFRLCGHSDVSLRKLIDKELETSSLDPASKAAIKTHIKRCGSILFTHFASIIGTQTITVVNVQIPPSDLNTHALQVSCLVRETIKINGGTNKPLLIGGEFNIQENDASYQLLRDGYLSNDKIDELQRRKDIAVPEKENSSLVDLLWKSFQHPSSNLFSCYNSVLDHELFVPELKATSPDLVWYSSGSLHTVGVLDVSFDKLSDRHISLKADIAFAV